MQWRRPLLQQMNLAALVPPPVARYGVTMILGQLGSARRLFFLAAFLLATAAAFAESKVVRLRNERIETPDKAQQLVQPLAQNPEPAHTGLFVLQFDGPVQTAWRAELKKHGVTLVRYVPDNAFIARADGVKLHDLETLPFVRWTGAFRPEHKVHGGLQNKNIAAADEVGVSILLAADATPPQLAGARGLMKRGASETASRFGQVWRGQVTRAQLNALAASDAVLWIERGPQIRLFDETASKIVGGDSGAHPTYVQALGYDGSGVVVAVADSGLHLGDANLMHPDLLGRVDALFFYGELTDASDEHGHGTHVAGIVAANGATGEIDDYGALWGLGVAPGAHVIAQRIFDGEGNYEAPPSFFDLTRDAVQAGADIGSNSWGDDTQGRYDLSAAEFDGLVRDADGTGHPYILEFSAGNAGPGAQTIGSPAVAKNVIATGAAENNRYDYFIYDSGQETMADFSSRGPCEDGRIKPDLTAPGTWISSLRSPVGNDEFAWGDISFFYMFQGGTSQSGPHASGAAAVFVQWYRESHTNATPSPALVKAALINSALDMDDETGGTSPAPNHDEGWGQIDLTEIIGSDRVFDFVDQAVTLATGQQFERHVIISDSIEPLKITLAYTDVPGFPGALAALVNDLDLEVIAPDGTTYHGNQFEGGASIPNAPGYDAINNVEAVHITVPLPGEYIVRIHARNVPSDARTDTVGVDQDFALVASGIMPPAGQGIVFLDRPAYTAPGVMKIKLIDASLATGATPNVTIKSATETNGFALVLHSAGYPGSFTGSVATAAGAAANDGVLQIAHGNWIRAEYFDVSANVTRTASAVADLLPPVITSVVEVNEYGEAVITWLTDEPATSVVRYNTNTPLSLVISNNFLVTGHSVVVANFQPGKTYKYAVSGTDAAGNTSTNNNGGVFFTFVAPTNATVLLVNAYTFDDANSDAEKLPLSVYTNALRAAGISFDVVSVTNLGIARLRPYPVVMWRINDAYDSSDSLSATQRNLITQYVTNGGSFFMSSMEILTRLIDGGGAGFVTNVLHVSRFTRNPLFSGCDTCDEDHTVPTAEGIPQDPITEGLLVDLDYSHYPEIEILGLGPDFADTFGVKHDATEAWWDYNSGLPAGLRYPRTGQESTGRVVFFSFPLDAIPTNGPDGNLRATVLRRVMQFLIPGLDGIGSIGLDRDGYTIPDAVTIEVADSDLAGTNQMTVQVYSDSVTNHIPVTLYATTHPGMFRGIATLMNTNAPPAAGRLRANNGDTIHALYVDASGGVTIAAAAEVDATAPTISGLLAVPDYESVTVTWTTSEDTDALVEFGESPFLGRTAYLEDFDTEHEIVLTGLVPDQVYYYRVISRDPSGNTVTADNFGTNYSVRTLVPLTPPFVDHFDAGADLWTVFNSEDTQVQWTLGVPNNDLATAGHSPPNAWGSSLHNDYADLIDTFLISPAIRLTGGNSARLQFWHIYDFREQTETDLITGGELLIITNANSAPISLAVYEDLNGGWELEDIDLSPHLGRVVYFVWHHQLLAFEAASRPGWLIDDVSVTVSTITPGTLRVTNNLSQAAYTIDDASGSVSITGQGTSFVLTNAVPGTYTVTWGLVTNWNTPAPQTASVVALGTTVFTGSYTLTDTNGNGIADSWERTWFGSASASHPATTDTDHDGLSDHGEFLAGTNPTNSASVLRFLKPVVQNTGAVRLDWPTVPGRSYRLTGSTNLNSWSTVADWTRANGSILSFTTSLTNTTRFYRLEVKP